jgi:hypothetical protein
MRSFSSTGNCADVEGGTNIVTIADVAHGIGDGKYSSHYANDAHFRG